MSKTKFPGRPGDPTRAAFERFVAAYVSCALWSTNDNSNEQGGEPLDKNYDADDILKATMREMRGDCLSFWNDHYELFRGREERAGHDFWLTREGHGAGFWDGGWPEPNATTLTKASEAYGSFDLYVFRGKVRH